MKKVWWNPGTWSPEERKFAVSAAVCLAAVALECMERCPSRSVHEKARRIRESISEAKALLE